MSEQPQVGDIVTKKAKYRVEDKGGGVARIVQVDPDGTGFEIVHISDLTVVERHPGGPGGAR